MYEDFTGVENDYLTEQMLKKEREQELKEMLEEERRFIEEMSREEYKEYYRDCTGESLDDRDDYNIGVAYHEYYDDDEFDADTYDWSNDPQ